MDELIKKYKIKMDKMMSDLLKKDKVLDRKLEKCKVEKTRRSVRKQKRR